MVGFGRKYAVISWALDSWTFSWPARKVGLAASNFSFTCCQVSAVCASARTNTPAHRHHGSHHRPFITPPQNLRLSFSASQSQMHLGRQGPTEATKPWNGLVGEIS